jgi:hypothetical protein
MDPVNDLAERLAALSKHGSACGVWRVQIVTPYGSRHWTGTTADQALERAEAGTASEAEEA